MFLSSLIFLTVLIQTLLEAYSTPQKIICRTVFEISSRRPEGEGIQELDIEMKKIFNLIDLAISSHFEALFSLFVSDSSEDYLIVGRANFHIQASIVFVRIHKVSTGHSRPYLILSSSLKLAVPLAMMMTMARLLKLILCLTPHKRTRQRPKNPMSVLMSSDATR